MEHKKDRNLSIIIEEGALPHIKPGSISPFLEGMITGANKLGLKKLPKVRFTNEVKYAAAYYQQGPDQISCSIPKLRNWSFGYSYESCAFNAGVHETVHAGQGRRPGAILRDLLVELPREVYAKVTSKSLHDVSPREKEATQITEELRKERFGW